MACYISSEKATSLAKKYSADLHVLHLTTEREIELFEAKPTKDKKITTEACIHHLIFTSDDYEEWGNFIKCNPSIKAPNNREALRQALKNNQIDKPWLYYLHVYDLHEAEMLEILKNMDEKF